MVDLIKPPAFVFLSMLLLSQGARAQDPQAVESPAVESRSPEFEGAAAAMRARLKLF